MDSFSAAVTFFQNGGLFMYPIALVLVATIAIAIERYAFLRRTEKENRVIWDNVQPLIAKGEFDGAASVVKDSETAIGRILREAKWKSPLKRA